MPSELVLRPAEAADADAIAGVHLAARATAVTRGQMPPSVHDEAGVRGWLADRLGRDEVWVAELDGEVAAYARFTATWLDDLYVLPAHQGTGLGGALLELVKSLRPDGFGLWVFASNLAAQQLYAGHGLTVTERTDGSDNEERSPDLRMEWPGAVPEPR
jgi:GNAT superfamily N-acetyltransferase